MNDLDKQVRHHDEDRWLASRFAPADMRARLIAIYALNHEIARTADVVTQPAIGDIRLAWWREALDEIAQGKPPRAHPLLQAIAEDDARSSVWERLIAARGKDLDAAPFGTWRALEDYVDATAGGVMRMAMAACGVDAEPHEPLVHAAAQAWGCVGLLRAEAHWRARGRALLPREGRALEEMSARVRRAMGEVRALSARLPAAAFPAVGYVVLAPDYLRAHERGHDGAPLLLRQFRLIASAATGRL
jgi:phytoene synthase